MEAYMIMDGMWGSCGKGLIAGYLAIERRPDLVVCNFGPNAGHTYFTPEDGPHGRRRVLTKQLPTGIVAAEATILIGPGALIDPEILKAEIDEFDFLNVRSRLYIHPNAAVVLPVDKDTESTTTRGIASTMKGTGAAAVRKITRHIDNEHPATFIQYVLRKDGEWAADYIISPEDYTNTIAKAKVVQIESAQGFDLSINHGKTYPFTTSRDITPEAICNDVGVPYRFVTEKIVAVRTFPIRVGHVIEEDGTKTGDSGPCYDDQKEISWEQVGAITGQFLEERTTVTNRIRRVFTFSPTQFRKMLWHVGECSLFINFMNYLTAEGAFHFVQEVEDIIDEAKELDDKAWGSHAVADSPSDSMIRWIGVGPNHENVIGG